MRFTFSLGFLCFAACFCVIAWMLGTGFVGTPVAFMTPIWAALAVVVLFAAGAVFTAIAMNLDEKHLKARRRWVIGTSSAIIALAIAILFSVLPSLAQGLSLISLAVHLFGASALAMLAGWALWPLSLQPHRRTSLYAGW